MKRFIVEHETSILQALSNTTVNEVVFDYHQRQIGYLQAERLAHLLVTLAVALFTLIAGIGAAYAATALWGAVSLLLLALLLGYIVHYYRLENAIQRWYRLSRQIERALGHPPKDSKAGYWG
ncbi:MAG: hypothetical protein JW841_11705 [Deltaproteobacteria bacterium]|nr:hypothetical protein [Deltaproteobacteria bacterium]